jgi:glucokinase
MSNNKQSKRKGKRAGAIGIDVGGTKLLFSLFDSSFQLLHEIKVNTPKNTRNDFKRVVVDSVDKLFHKATKSSINVTALGIGCAGSIDTEKGIVKQCPNLPRIENFDFIHALGKFDGRVSVQNDLNAALYGELKLGAAAGYKHVIAVFIGTGIGGAIAIDGRLYFGAAGHAGDIGHYLVQPFGPLAGSERHGVLDDVASRIAIAGEAAVLAAKQWAPHLLKAVGTDVLQIKSQALAKAIKEGDKSIEELVRSRAQIVGIVLSNLVDFLNPEMVLIGGGLTDALPELVRSEIEAGIAAHATANANQNLVVTTTALKGRAVATGAAMMAFDSRH